MKDAVQMIDDDRDGRVVTFYSYKGGTGRTMTLANAAWILAANGKRVLTVDWDLEAPGLSRFFHPFLNADALATTDGVLNMINNYLERAFVRTSTEQATESGRAAVEGYSMGLNWDFPNGGAIDFISAGTQNDDYSAILNGLNWDQFYQEYEGGTFLDALRQEMIRRYDYVLIDSRTGLSDTSKICTQHLPDDVVVCFTLSDQSIDGAAGVARHIERRYGDRDIQILPVPMRVDEGEKERADRGRAVARQRFRGFPKVLHTLNPAQYWGSVEIPYRAFYAYEEVLATFGDTPGNPTTVLGACERLVRELTAGKVEGLPAMPEPLRLATLAKFTRKALPRRSDVLFRIWYAIEDQMWAEWVEFVLEQAGYQVTVARIEQDTLPNGTAPAPASVPGPVSLDAVTGAPVEAAEPVSRLPRNMVDIPLVTRHFLRTSASAKVWGPVQESDPVGTRSRTVGLRLGSVPPAPAGQNAPLDLSSPALVGASAAEQLVRHVGGDEEAVTLAVQSLDGAGAPRYPGLRTAIISLQDRNEDFTGRAAELTLLRKRLTDQDGGRRRRVQTLHGLGGVGKSQLAREYAYRYQADYDIVWWVSAERRSSTISGLANLAQRLEVRGSLSDTDAALAVRDALTEGRPHAHWLLIFDNAEDPETLRDFLPGGTGHVVITSRNQVWSGEATEQEVDVFTTAESITHLCRRVDWLTEDQARELAVVQGDLPLTVEHAAAYLETYGVSVERYIDLLTSQPAVLFSDAPLSDYPDPIWTTFATSLAGLEREWPAAKRLLQMSVFLGPGRFSQTLVYKSQEMLRALSAVDPRLRRSPALLGRVVSTIRRLSLAKVDGRTDSIEVHRLLQTYLKMEMTDAEAAEIRDEVRDVLVGQRPLGGEVEDPENRPSFERIRPHLTACAAEASERPEVRQLMIDLVRLLWRGGEFQRGRTEAERIYALWRTTLGEGDVQTLALHTLRANLLRDLGEFQAALALDERTWAAQRELLGEDDHGALVTARGMAAGLRALGRYQEALDRDLRTYESLRAQYDEFDRNVLSTAHNLAIDYRLMGDAKTAQRFDEQTERTRRQVLGPTNDRTLSSQLYLARDKRDSGELRDAAVDLERLVRIYRETRGSNHPDTLRAAKSLAVSRRVLGDYQGAAELTKDTFSRCLATYGPDHPDTWTCGLNLAADEWCTGKHEEALRRAEEIREHFVRALGPEHPNTLGCADNISVYLRRSGAPQPDIERSVDMGADTVRSFTLLLGETHPFTLCAEMNWANARAELQGELSADQQGPLRGVAESERLSLDRLRQTMGAAHPDTLACRSNLAVTLRALGQSAEAEALHNEALAGFLKDRNFGAAHPETVRAQGWERISHVLELHSW